MSDSARKDALALQTPLCELLGCRYPVVQTAMGWVAGPELVAATSNAGGFGFLAGATIAADQIEADILKVKQLNGDKPFGLNFHMYQPNAQQLLDLAVVLKAERNLGSERQRLVGRHLALIASK